MNNYKMLITNHDKTQKFKFYNNINDTKEFFGFIKIVNSPYVKILFIALLLLSANHQLSKFTKSNNIELQKVENLQNQKSSEFCDSTFLKNEMHSYSLYNTFRIPKFSFIIMNGTIKSDIVQIIDQIKTLTSQNFTNIEIILFLIIDNMSDYSQLKKEFNGLMKRNILIIYNKKRNVNNDYSELINTIKGYYTMFIDNLDDIKNLNLEQMINFTKGKIDNYFNFTFSDKSSLYLMKTKLLKNSIDNGVEVNSFKDIINLIISYSIPNLHYIPISLCPDNHFTSLAYVTMSSILSSKTDSTYISFYLITPEDFENKNILFLDTLYEDYYYFNMTFIKIDNRYSKAYTDRRITKQAYYRFSLGELLPNLNKIIYLDTDTIAYKDLTNFYNINFNGKMILGQPSYGNRNAQKMGYFRINSGILLLNLLEMRKCHFEKQVIDFISKGIVLKYHDQTLLNDYFKEYLGIYPPEYHTRPWSNYTEIQFFNGRIGNVFDGDYFYFVHKYPTIRHFLGKYKPRNRITNYVEDWWYFARKSRYYNKKANSFDSAFSF